MVLILAIALLDEIVFGAREAAWPQIRDDLGLSYVQIGILLSAPALFSTLVEPLLYVLADTRLRWVVLTASGAAYTLAIVLAASAGGFTALLVAMLIMYPASGGFVGLAQATYMDAEPGRRDQNMARWIVAGSVGALLGSLAIALTATNVGWRPVFFAGAAFGLLLTLWSMTHRRGVQRGDPPGDTNLRTIIRDAIANGKRLAVLRWLVLLQVADLLGDIFLGFLAVYLVDSARAEPWIAATAVTLWIGAGLAGSLLLVPVLERRDGLSVVRLTAIASCVTVPLFLLVPGVWPKLVLVAVLGLIATPWYPVLQSRLYAEMPGRSGTAIALSSVSQLAGAWLPMALGATAALFGLQWAMWIVLAAPLMLLLLTPRKNNVPTERPSLEADERPTQGTAP